MRDVRYVSGTPTADAFKGTEPPIVVDRDSGTVYVLATGDVVTPVSGGGGGGGAPTNATYIVQTADATLTAERVATNTATIAWDFSVAGQARLNVVPAYLTANQTITLSGDATGSGTTAITVTVPGLPKGATAYVDFGSTPNSRKTATVTDANVSGSSRIMVTWGAVLDTDDNDPEMDDVTFHAIPGSGQFTLVASSQRKIAGRMRVNYTVA